MLPYRTGWSRCLAACALLSSLSWGSGSCSRENGAGSTADPAVSSSQTPTSTSVAPTDVAPSTLDPVLTPDAVPPGVGTLPQQVNPASGTGTDSGGGAASAPTSAVSPPGTATSPDGSPSSSVAPSSPADETNSNDGTNSAETGADSSGNNASDATSVDPAAPGEPAVRFVGRFVEAAAGAMSFEWSGSGMLAAFEGTSVSVRLEDGGSNEFSVLIDGQLMPKLSVQPGNNDYALATGLSPGAHTVELYRRTEASFGTTTFGGFDFGSDGRLLPPPAARPRRIEIIGDSISCGYGIEGTSTACGFTADTENHYATYGALAARTLDAEVVTIAWSGKGIIYNYDADRTDPLPTLYDRTLPSNSSSRWGFMVIPDAVVINLGTNDFSTDDDPPPDLFHDEYVAFLEHLRDVYPNTFILCTVGPLLNGADLDAARAGIESAVSTRQAAGDAQVATWDMNIPNENPGCDYHPGLATHETMASALVAELQAHLDW